MHANAIAETRAPTAPRIWIRSPELCASAAVIGFAVAYVASTLLPLPRLLYFPTDGHFTFASAAPGAMGYFGLWVNAIAGSFVAAAFAATWSPSRTARWFLCMGALATTLAALVLFLVME
jgi:hypothetical protein